MVFGQVEQPTRWDMIRTESINTGVAHQLEIVGYARRFGQRFAKRIRGEWSIRHALNSESSSTDSKSLTINSDAASSD
jgi:hypothetical protein